MKYYTTPGTPHHYLPPRAPTSWAETGKHWSHCHPVLLLHERCASTVAYTMIATTGCTLSYFQAYLTTTIRLSAYQKPEGSDATDKTIGILWRPHMSPTLTTANATYLLYEQKYSSPYDNMPNQQKYRSFRITNHSIAKHANNIHRRTPKAGEDKHARTRTLDSFSRVISKLACSSRIAMNGRFQGQTSVSCVRAVTYQRHPTVG